MSDATFDGHERAATSRTNPSRSVGPRGRGATTPTAIPAKGWKDIAWRVYKEFNDDRIMLVAAGVTFYILLALVPALSAGVSVYGLFFDAAAVATQVASLQGVIPGGGVEIIQEQLTRLAEQTNSSLSITFIVSLGIALWSANAGMKSIFDGLNIAYDEIEQRGFVKLTMVSLAFTFGGIVAVFILGTVVVGLPAYLSSTRLGATFETVLQIGGYVLMLAVLAVAFSALYRWGPSRDHAKWRWITPGGLVAAVVLVVTSIGFSWYVANFGSYNATYGSLGAIIGFMTWIWIASIILLMGAELNAEMEHQTRRDTTVGTREPLGDRGAVVADSVGARWGSDDVSPDARQAASNNGDTMAVARDGSDGNHPSQDEETGSHPASRAAAAGPTGPRVRRRVPPVSTVDKLLVAVPLALFTALLARDAKAKRGT